MSSKRVTPQDGRFEHGRSFETSETSEQTSYLEDLRLECQVRIGGIGMDRYG